MDYLKLPSYRFVSSNKILSPYNCIQLNRTVPFGKDKIGMRGVIIEIK